MLGFNQFLDQAQAFIVVCEEHAVLMPQARSFVDSQHYAREDLGTVAAFIYLAAADQGLGVCQIGTFDRERIYQALNLLTDKRIHTLFAFGYPADDRIRAKKRRGLAEMVRVV